MACDCLELCYSLESPTVPEAWRMIEGVLCEFGELDAPFELSGKSIPGGRIGEVLANRSSTYFHAVGGGYEINHSSSRAWGFITTWIESAGGRAPSVWDRWVAALAGKSLVAAFLFDKEYWYWQSQEDPDSFRQQGRPYEHLPMRSNELPPPLTQQVIDTSRNPGRRLFRDGYVEAVGAVMWLGPRFAERTGASLDALRAADWCTVTEFAPGVLRVQVQDRCFTSAEGREAELQDRLRSVLFPNAN